MRKTRLFLFAILFGLSACSLFRARPEPVWDDVHMNQLASQITQSLLSDGWAQYFEVQNQRSPVLMLDYPQCELCADAFMKRLTWQLLQSGGLRILAFKDESENEQPSEILAVSAKEAGADFLIKSSFTPLSTKGKRTVQIDIEVLDLDSGDTVHTDSRLYKQNR